MNYFEQAVDDEQSGQLVITFLERLIE